MSFLRSKLSVAQSVNNGILVTFYYDQVHLHGTDHFKFPKPRDFMKIDQSFLGSRVLGIGPVAPEWPGSRTPSCHFTVFRMVSYCPQRQRQLHIPLLTRRKEEGQRRSCLFALGTLAGSYAHPIGQKVVTWPHLAVGVVDGASIAGTLYPGMLRISVSRE